jgi:hypothetical protein
MKFQLFVILTLYALTMNLHGMEGRDSHTLASAESADCTPTDSSAMNHRWQRYTHAKFGTTLCFPADQLHPDPATPYNDGGIFRSADGQIELRVYGQYNVMEDTPKQHEARIIEEMADAQITYNTRGEEWFVLSGLQGENIFYEKYLFSSKRELIHGLSLTYPAEEKQALNGVITHIIKSFKSIDQP